MLEEALPLEAAVPVAAVTPLDAAVAVPAAVPPGPTAAAMVSDAAGSVLPAIANAPSILAATPPPPLALPSVPGFPTLPTELTIPRDFVCEGTAWSAHGGTDGDPHLPAGPKTQAGRTDW